MKDETRYWVVERREVVRGAGVLGDDVIELTGQEATVKCRHRLRRIHYRDVETGEKLALLTNHPRFAAFTIALIYKERRQVEVFFKALKPNL